MSGIPDHRDEVLQQLTEYIRREIIREADAGGAVELTPDSPLLEWGILNSLNTVRLLAFLRDEWSAVVPPVHITGRHFRDLNSITDLVLSLPRS
ncbi:hypothetical protein Prum_052830 [Phytohabitans rumicis]|uniref:Carrier domain-containing protein n=1 Tax=Phytohabitans rumicis TaxID=1076125 RepID=A0A6V8LA25_9ACTN|nr:hypothetical protein Prum_052830 [Phytohabitans rumicis]